MTAIGPVAPTALEALAVAWQLLCLGLLVITVELSERRARAQEARA